MTTMNRRQRLNFGDNQLKRADELCLRDVFVDAEWDWMNEGMVKKLVLREVLAVAREGNDDVLVTCVDGCEFSTSEGNTFLVLPHGQKEVV